MPEGDTIYKIARYLEAKLVSRRIEAMEIHPTFRAVPITGEVVEAVRPHGKHLYIDFAGAGSIRSHLGMNGSWHEYAHGERWRRPRRFASLVMKTDERVFVCFRAMEVETVDRHSVRERHLQQRLGPDLIADDGPLDEVPRRARELLDADAPLIDVLLDQRVTCGIGNVYKSEILFIERFHPLRPLGQVPDPRVQSLFETGRDLLRRNLDGGHRVTRFVQDGRGRQWVYGRLRKPCLQCGTGIEYARLGATHRSTYWCPRCQLDPSMAGDR